MRFSVDVDWSTHTYTHKSVPGSQVPAHTDLTPPPPDSKGPVGFSSLSLSPLRAYSNESCASERLSDGYRTVCCQCVSAFNRVKTHNTRAVTAPDPQQNQVQINPGGRRVPAHVCVCSAQPFVFSVASKCVADAESSGLRPYFTCLCGCHSA